MRQVRIDDPHNQRAVAMARSREREKQRAAGAKRALVIGAAGGKAALIFSGASVQTIFTVSGVGMALFGFWWLGKKRSQSPHTLFAAYDLGFNVLSAA